MSDPRKSARSALIRVPSLVLAAALKSETQILNADFADFRGFSRIKTERGAMGSLRAQAMILL